jgi:uncharacterized protein
MIKNSFIFLEKVSHKKEESLWLQGIKDWHTFLKKPKVRGISEIKKHYYNQKIKEAQKALLNEKYSYFQNILPKKEMWRFYDFLKDECCFLDIEINSHGKIILVGVSDYYNTFFFLKSRNLNKYNLEQALSKYKLIITFNGSAFDLPKLKKELKISLDQIHIDLKPLCVNLNMAGGLKEVERQLNLRRPPHLYGNPIGLWKSFHASQDSEYLDLLMEYNREDIENLKVIMEFVYKRQSNKIYKLLNTS